MKYCFFALILLFTAACQSNDTIETETNTAKGDEWQGVPTSEELDRARPLRVRYEEAQKGLAESWEAIKSSDKLRNEKASGIIEALPTLKGFQKSEALTTFTEDVRWLEQNPMTTENISDKAFMDEYDERLARVGDLADTLMTNPNMTREVAAIFDSFYEVDGGDLIRRIQYTDWVTRNNEIVEQEMDSLKALGFDSAQARPIFSYVTEE
ncbi:MAG: hypothetical protein AAF740_09490 [Bacteroidota bacterium]